MADLRGYSREFITEFISLYRQNTCLWKIKSAEYSNHNKKQAAYDVLCDKLKEKDPMATKDAVIKKINSLRSCFRKEMKKAKESEKSGAGEDDIYKPSLWYFDLLLFLLDQETPRESTSNMNEKDEIEAAAGDIINEDEDDDFTSPLLSPDIPSSIRSQASSSQTSSPKRKGRNDKSDEILGLVANKLKASDFQQYESYGKHIAEELRTLTPEQAAFCQKLINDAIFEAKFGSLGRSSKIVSEQNNFQLSTSSAVTHLEATFAHKQQYTPQTYTNSNIALRQSQNQGPRYDAAQSQDPRYDAAQFFHTFNENV